MASYLARRAAVAVLLLWGVATVTFFLIHAAPGDPADIYLFDDMDPRARRAVLEAFGLDRPLLEQYGRWLIGLASGQLGWSTSHHRPVVEVMAERIPATLQLAVPAFLLHLAAGVAVGIAGAWRRGTLLDAIASGGSLVLYCVPSFWLGAVLILVFAVHLGWLPSSGMRDLSASPVAPLSAAADRARHLVLPVICLGLGSAAATARFVRSGILEALAREYAAAARSRGAAAGRLLIVHALRNACLPVIALAGMSLPLLLGGSVLVETVFAWPGMGSLSVEAVFARDYPLVLAAQMTAAAAVLAGSAAADVGLSLADPRLRGGPRP